MVENHAFCTAIRGSRNRKALERHLQHLLDTKPNTPIEGTHLLRPCADFNALFLTAHSFGHFLTEGIKLRHILDWALLLRAEQDNIDWGSFYEWCDKMHYTRFVECLNLICEKYLGVNAMAYNRDSSAKSLSYDKEKMATRILKDVFHGNSIYTKGYGYFGFRFALAMSYFKSLW